MKKKKKNFIIPLSAINLLIIKNGVTHDAFEDLWNNLDGDERQIIQGILQVSVSQFHLSKGNINGATILLGEGLGRIKLGKVTH